MEELVALIFTFCTSPTVLSNPNDTETIIACNTYVTSCTIGEHSRWDKKKLKQCETEGLSKDWKYEP